MVIKELMSNYLTLDLSLRFFMMLRPGFMNTKELPSTS